MSQVKSTIRHADKATGSKNWEFILKIIKKFQIEYLISYFIFSSNITNSNAYQQSTEFFICDIVWRSEIKKKLKLTSKGLFLSWEVNANHILAQSNSTAVL